MTDAEYAALAFEIRSFAGIGVKLMIHDLDQRLAEHLPGISGPQYGVMHILNCNPSTIRELSDHMMLAPSTLVPIVDRLESEGMVVRGRDPDDRRRTPLMLTEHARHLLSQVPPVDANDRLCKAMNVLGADKSRQLSQMLQELIALLAPELNIPAHILAVSARLQQGFGPCSPGNAESTPKID